MSKQMEICKIIGIVQDRIGGALMFYCQPCGDAATWPTDFWLLLSQGAFEICGQTAVCFDVPSSRLPDPSPEFTTRRLAGEHEIQEKP